jgi:hypothetical protein
MKVLFLTTVLPHNKRIGSEVASQSVIEGLRKNGVQVTVVGYLRRGETLGKVSDTIAIGSRYIETRQARLYPILWMLISVFKRLPYSTAKYYSRTYIRQVKKLFSKGDYAAVVIDHPQMKWLTGLVPERSKQVFIAHNIENQMYTQLSQGSKGVFGRWLYSREAKKIRKAEIDLAKTVSEIWTLTAHDANYFKGILAGAVIRVMTLPPTAVVEEVDSDCHLESFDIGLIGSWAWQANQDGLRWFLDMVYPRLTGRYRIRVAGKGADWLVGKYSNLKYEGFVPDAIEFMRKARVVAIPTLSGGGIQIKTLDAISSGSMIVATRCAVRGINSPPDTVKVADTAEEFADKLMMILSNVDYENNSLDAIAWTIERRRQFVAEIGQVVAALA